MTLQPFLFAVVGCHDACTVSQLRPLCCMYTGLLDIPSVSRQCDAIRGSPVLLHDPDIGVRRNKMNTDGELLRSIRDTNLKTMRIAVRVVTLKRSAWSITVLVGELDTVSIWLGLFTETEPFG